MNPATHQRICAEIQERHQREMAAVVGQRDELAAALEKLARLGNEPHYGNSIGNHIARDVLAKVGDGDTATEGHNA